MPENLTALLLRWKPSQKWDESEEPQKKKRHCKEKDSREWAFPMRKLAAFPDDKKKKGVISSALFVEETLCLVSVFRKMVCLPVAFACSRTPNSLGLLDFL
jgi:hypothetical protein